MRELTNEEISRVSGGNFFYGLVSIVSAYETGKAAGNYVNDFNRSNFNMSFGEALYYTFN